MADTLAKQTNSLSKNFAVNGWIIQNLKTGWLVFYQAIVITVVATKLFLP